MMKGHSWNETFKKCSCWLTGGLEYKTLLFWFWSTETPPGWETSPCCLLNKTAIQCHIRSEWHKIALLWVKNTIMYFDFLYLVDPDTSAKSHFGITSISLIFKCIHFVCVHTYFNAWFSANILTKSCWWECSLKQQICKRMFKYICRKWIKNI